MIIVHVITAFGFGGAEKLLLNIVNKQIEEHSVHLIYLKSIDGLLSQLDKRIEVKNIPISLSTIKQLKNYYKKTSPDIIHTHLGHADFLGIWSARKTKAKVFCTMHNIYFKKNLFDIVFFELYKFLFLNIVKRGCIISISKAVEAHVVKRLKLPKERSYLLLNAIPSRIIENKKENHIKIKLLFVGRLEKQKNINTLFKAIEHLKSKNLKKEFQLTIVGDGKLKNELKKLTRVLKIENIVKFEGEQKEVDSFYSNSDIFILPSIWEGFGIVILEAFRAKLAVIVSNIEGPSELVSDKMNGLLFEPENHLQLAEKIKELIINDVLRERLALKGHESFTQKYHINNYVENLNRLYKDA